MATQRVIRANKAYASNNTRMLMRNDGFMTAAFDYSPSGEVSQSLGQGDSPLQFNGQYKDDETGLTYLRARYLDTSTNQFMSTDPLSALTKSIYGYAGNDGVNGEDPSGLFPSAKGRTFMLHRS